MRKDTIVRQLHTECIKKTRLAALIALLMIIHVIFPAGPALADPTLARAGGPLSWEHNMTGNWGGLRPKLAEKGFTFTLQHDIYVQYNTTGGIETGWGWENRMVPEINWQLEPLLGLKGTEFQVSGAWNWGEDTNEKVGAIIIPDTIWREDAVRLYELYLGQYFFDEQLHVKIGRLGLGPFESGYSVFMLEYMSAGYSSSPGGMFLNQPTTTFAFPIATWGARAVVKPKDTDIEVRLGVYNGYPRNLADADKGGVDFSLELDESTFVMGEFGYKLNQDPGDKGLPGNYKVGFMYDSGSFERFDQPGESKRNNPGFYVIFDQMLHREANPDYPAGHPANWKVGWRQSHPTTQGLYVWGAFVGNPDEDINIAPYWLSGGLAYKGLISGRPADRLGIGFYHAFFTSDVELDDETHIEGFYKFQVTSWLGVGLDVQYVINPALSGGGDDAVVVGTAIQMFY